MSHPLPRYCRPSGDPSLRDMMRMTSGDPGIAMPESLYCDWSYKLKTRWGPLIVSQPEAIEQVLFDQRRFGRNRQLKRLIGRAWKNGLAGSEGERWKTQRRAVGPHFRSSSVARHVDQMKRGAHSAVRRWQSLTHLDVQHEAGRIVSEIVLNTLILGSDSPDYNQLAADTASFMRAVTKFDIIDQLPLPDSLVDTLRGTYRSPSAKRLKSFAGALAMLRAHANDEIDDPIAALKEKGPIAENILGFVTASFETSARGVAWTLYALACLPDLQERVRKEINTASSLSGNAFADALALTRRVVKESLRMFPPAPNTARATLESVELLGHQLPKNLPVIIDIHALHHHDRIWVDPWTFNPDRFVEKTSLRHRASYIPFSAGPRMCVAAHFAELEIMVIVAELLRVFRFVPSKPLPELSFHISTHSKTGLHVSLQPV